MNRHTEQEWQFAASELGPARNWLAAQTQDPTERRCAPQPTLSVQDTYYDSPDWMIFRAGFALRVRRSRETDATDAASGDVAADAAGNAAGSTEITLKSLRPVSQNGGNGGLAQRTEFTEQVGQADLAQVLARGEGIGERIRQLVGSRPLAPLFHARTRRERQRLLEADSELPLAEVDLDETSIETPSGQSRELRRVEVECIHADPAALSPWVEQLRDAAQLQPVESSKFRAGLEAAGLTPAAAPALNPIRIAASQSFADAQLVLLGHYFALALEKEGAVRGGSVAAVHEMRVAARHIDVLLRVFRGYGPAWAVASRGRVQGLIKVLGAVRDCDVQLGFLDEKLAAQGPDERAALLPLRERLVVRQQKARTRLLQALDSPPVQTWMREWRQHLAASTPGSARAQRARTAVVARRLIREQARALRKRARRLSDNSAPDDYHGVRIRAKRLRYTIDAFASLYGEAAEDYVRALAKLQTTLGGYNDSKLREQKFAELVSQGPRLPASTSFLAGRLVERDAHAAERLRRAFTRAYRRIRRRRWRALATVMKREAQSASGTLDSVKPG